MDGWLPWVLLPVVGAVIGYATNWVAIKMLFHPRQKRWGLQGLLPRRQADLAKSIGAVVAEELVDLDQLLAPLHEMDLKPHFAELIDKVLAEKLDDLKKIPLIGAMINPSMLGGLRDMILKQLDKHQPELITGLIGVARDHIDIADMVASKLSGFDLDQLEALVVRVAKQEFRAIELWGALLGLMIGLAQAALLMALG